MSDNNDPTPEETHIIVDVPHADASVFVNDPDGEQKCYARPDKDLVRVVMVASRQGGDVRSQGVQKLSPDEARRMASMLEDCADEAER